MRTFIMIEIIVQFIFWFSLLCLLHTYAFYPMILRLLCGKKKQKETTFLSEEQWPRVSVVMSVYNEASVISEKIIGLIEQNYPAGKLAVYVGSDASSDSTNQIMSAFARDFPMIRFFPFEERRGKPGVINELVEKAFEDTPQGPDHVLIITDANVMLTADAVHHLIRHFHRPEIALVDAHMVHTGMQSDGISRSEDYYISKEVWIKHREGLLWGAMVGPFGGCYAIRSDYFQPVPPNYLVDDFYIAMRALEAGGKAINDLNAVCYESVSHQIKDEYRRKARIAAGNFQNLVTFWYLWWPPLTKLGFAFFSHKILRWLSPLWLSLMLLSALVLTLTFNLFYVGALLLLISALIGVPILDYCFNKFKINILPLRSMRYFVFMNIALAQGFFRFIKGIKSNVWEPVSRIRH